MCGKPSGKPSGKTILLVDDQLICREMFSLVLQREGYHVHCAADGVDAFSALARCTPDLIILDDDMPKLDGIGFLERYSRSGHEKAPVILMTADEEWNTVVEASKFGVFDHIYKSQFALAQTRERIARYVGARKTVEVAGAI